MIDIDVNADMGYTFQMPRQKKDEKRDETLTVKVPETLYIEVRALVDLLDRTESYIGYRLIERGLAAYKRDGKLIEDTPVGAIDKLPVYKAEDENASKSKRSKRNKA